VGLQPDLELFFMTQDEIIEMAKKAGFERLGVYAQFGDDWVGFTEELGTFAKLVAQREREACAKLAETPQGEYEVVVACGAEPAQHLIPKYLSWQDIAAAIRARGQA
jgi:hypothetical protein